VRALKEHEPALCRSFYERTGCPMHACYPLAKIIWLKRNRPELFARTKYIGSIKDHLFHAFTGEFLIDRSTASTTALYNARALAWDAEILNFIGITEEMLQSIEAEITNIEGSLPPLTKFLVPGETKAEAFLDFARTTARMAERRAWSLSRRGTVEDIDLRYLNRISDYLFILMRLENEDIPRR